MIVPIQLDLTFTANHLIQSLPSKIGTGSVLILQCPSFEADNHGAVMSSQ